MKRRAFLKALAAGTAAAFLGDMPALLTDREWDWRWPDGGIVRGIVVPADYRVDVLPTDPQVITIMMPPRVVEAIRATGGRGYSIRKIIRGRRFRSNQNAPTTKDRRDADTAPEPGESDARRG